MTEWDKQRNLTKLVFGPVLTPPLGALIAEGDRLQETIKNMDAQEKVYIACIDKLKKKVEMRACARKLKKILGAEG